MIFFLTLISFLSLVYLYAGLRFIPHTAPIKFKAFVWFVLSAILISLVAHFYLRITFAFPQLSQVLAWIGYGGLGFVSYLFLSLVVRDLLFLAGFSALCLRKQVFKKHPSPIEQPQRRQFLFQASGYTLAALSGSVTLAGAAIALKKPKIVHVDIPLKPEHAHMKGLTIAQFTDLHAGPTVKRPYVEQVCEQVAQLHADMIVFTGDLADGSPLHLADDVAPLKNLSAGLGKYFITGNHEYYSGAQRWVDTAGKLGFEPLINEHRIIHFKSGCFTLAGVTDLRGGAFLKSHASDPEKALNNSPKDNYKILLAHQPPSIYKASTLGVDLQLSGHTHGGQYFPFGYFVYVQHPFLKGMYIHKKTRLYVSQGTGYWGPPLRLGTFSEITLFTFC